MRFIGDAGYVVTFRQTDPLYTLDLSDPAHPRVRGELKILGYSAYLHPVGDDLLLGIGQDATERRAALGHPALAVRRLRSRAPAAASSPAVEDSSSSDVEYDHHAFLWWAPSKLAVLPVHSYAFTGEDSPPFSGAIGFGVERSSGISERGRAVHDADSDHWPWPIERTLVVGGRLFTLSQLGTRDERDGRPVRAAVARVPAAMKLEFERHSSDALTWEMTTRAAPPALRGLVRNYTGYVERSTEPLARREVPTGDVTLILSPANELTLPDGRHSSFVAALHDSHTVVEHDGFQEGIEVRLTPLGTHALFGLPMHELTNRVVELGDLIGHDAGELVGRIWDEAGWERRFAVVVGRDRRSGGAGNAPFAGAQLGVGAHARERRARERRRAGHRARLEPPPADRPLSRVDRTAAQDPGPRPALRARLRAAPPDRGAAARGRSPSTVATTTRPT